MDDRFNISRLKVVFSIGVCILVLLITSCGNTESSMHNFDIEIEEFAMIVGESTLTVKQRDQVVLNIKSDEDITFHIHGYDHKIEVPMEEVTIFEFVATSTGSFPFTLHATGFDQKHDHEHSSHEHEDKNGEIELGRFEVYPR